MRKIDIFFFIIFSLFYVIPENILLGDLSTDVNRVFIKIHNLNETEIKNLKLFLSEKKIQIL